MTARSGLGAVDVLTLQALHAVGARPERPRLKATTLVDAVDDATGLGPGPSFDVLLNHARPWVVTVPLVSFQGNIGTVTDEAAAPRYLEARLSGAGGLVVAAEVGQIAPVPVGLITGNTHRGGSRPPFNPEAVIVALKQLIERPDTRDEELLELVGPPEFPGLCDIDGDLDAVLAGQPTAVTLRPRVAIRGERRITATISNFPPGLSGCEILEAISPSVNGRPWTQSYPELARHLRNPFAQVDDLTGFGGKEDRIECVGLPVATAEGIQRFLRTVWNLSVNLVLDLRAPLPTLLRRWVADARRDELTASLDQLWQCL